ncbi:MAG: nitroreductase family protein [Proteobacteria bacterium]|nr:nitroreductase family protein [Pseudomonadota bacterium]
MELKEVIGRRRSVRFLRPYRPVERAKIQKMLEAARLASFWGNVQALDAVVIERATAPQDLIDALPVGTAIGGFQFRTAPVIIVWLVNWDRIPAQGQRLHELVDAGALGVHPEKSHKYLDDVLIPFFDKAMEGIRDRGITEADCGQGIAQATLVAYEEGLGTCVLAAFAGKKLRKALGLTENMEILLLQTVGYPAEDPLAGGQRPKLPFEEKFSLNRVGNPFPRSPAVVDELRAAGMLCDTAPLAFRREELRYLQQQYGLSDVFGDEIPGLIKAAEAEAQDE